MQQHYAYMYLGLGVNTRKTVFHPEYEFAEKDTSSIMTRYRFVDAFSMVLIRHFLFFLLNEESQFSAIKRS